MPEPADFAHASLDRLEAALRDHGSDLRNVQLGTVSPEGAPGVRTVVLRGFERRPACAEVHSDARAAKVRDIAGDGRVVILAWSAAEQLQLRFAGVATLHCGDALALARWEALPAKARQPYGLRAASGAPIADPAHSGHLPPDEQFAQFTVIRVALATADILLLGAEGRQTRALAAFSAGGLTACWVSA